jgi:exodeoxyribonuclease III
MKIATWNVNGIRAREAQVLSFIETVKPDVLCLQEIKAAPAKVPLSLCELSGYWCYWHGETSYSGVGLHVSKESFKDKPVFSHPAFDHETRIVTARAGNLVFASIYVPNGGKDFDAKMRFLVSLEEWVGELHGQGLELVLCGDMNVAHRDMDVHPKERKPVIGQRPDERALFSRLLSRGLVDVGRAVDPENDQLFSWWAPWRNMRERNIGWRLDYVLASESVHRRVVSCTVDRSFGTSDHGPVVAEFGAAPGEEEAAPATV